MIIRPLGITDKPTLERIHKEFYSDEFSLDDLRNILQMYAVVNEDNKIVCIGGIKSIAESILFTDKSFSVRERREALYKLLQAEMFVCNRLGYDELHAFIQDPTWLKHLKRVGFKETKGESVVLCL